MSRAWDVVIAGAGIVGAACALECVRGGLRTAVVESSGIAAGATAAAMGHIVIMDDSPAQMALTRYSQKLWQELSANLPAEVEYESRGTLWLASDEEEMGEVHRKHGLYASAGIPTEVLDSRMLAEAEPHLRRELAGALLVSPDAVLDPIAATGYLMEEALRLGAQLYAPRTILSAGAGKMQLDDGAQLHAANIVLATGADTTRLLPGVPIRKRKGHVAIAGMDPGFVRRQLAELGYLKSAHSVTTDSVAFNVQPRKSGQILIGSSRQYDVEDAGVNQEILAAMIGRAQSFLPEIGEISAMRVRTGFRAATPDKLPLIGPWSEDETLFLATGHEGLGITTSLATARLLVGHLLGSPTEISMQPYLPVRLNTGNRP